MDLDTILSKVVALMHTISNHPCFFYNLVLSAHCTISRFFSSNSTCRNTWDFDFNLGAFATKNLNAAVSFAVLQADASVLVCGSRLV